MHGRAEMALCVSIISGRRTTKPPPLQDFGTRKESGGIPYVSETQLMKVVILAGGFGTRISEESAVRPKPMVEIGDKPILWHIMKLYATHGIDEFVIAV